jgi:hypothetical protein
MTLRSFAMLSLPLVAVLGTGCLPAIPAPPTKGYAEPYRGNGKPVYVKDSRDEFKISQSNAEITSEQALEITDDKEYETRRQIAKEYNKRLFAEGEDRHSTGKILMGTGTGVMLVGIAAALLGPNILRDQSTVPASATAPETREDKAGGAATASLIGGIALAVIGVGVIYYGYSGAKEPPPYFQWHTPDALNRPAYVRQMTEPYNEKIGAPAVAEQPGSVESVTSAPGQRKAPPHRPGAPAGAKGTGP